MGCQKYATYTRAFTASSILGKCSWKSEYRSFVCLVCSGARLDKSWRRERAISECKHIFRHHPLTFRYRRAILTRNPGERQSRLESVSEMVLLTVTPQILNLTS